MSGAGSGPAALPGLFGPWDALATGALSVFWYALPDHVPSRRQRVLVKAGLTGASLGWGLVSRPTPVLVADLPAGEDEDTAASWWGRRGPAARRALTALVVGGTAALAVGAEVGLYRLGERSARRGARLPHTRNGVVVGALSTVAFVAADRVWRRWAPAHLSSSG